MGLDDFTYDQPPEDNVVPLRPEDRVVERPPKPPDDPSAMYRLDEFLDAELYEPPTLIDGIMPGGTVTILAGQHKVGKTLLMTQIGMSVAAGTPFLHWSTKQRPVLYLNYEVAAWSFRNRLKQQEWGFGQLYGADKKLEVRENLYTVSLPDVRLNKPKNLEWLGRRAKELDVGLVIIDPIRGSFQGNRNSDEEVDRVMQNIIELVVEPSGAGIILGHHMRKPPPGERVSGSSWEVKGSSSWADAADSVITMRWDKTERLLRYLSFTLRHFDAPDDAAVELKPASLVFEPSDGGASEREMLRRAFQVEEHGVPELSLTLDEIVEKLGKSRTTVQRMLSDRGHPIEIDNSGKKNTYRWKHQTA